MEESSSSTRLVRSMRASGWREVRWQWGRWIPCRSRRPKVWRGGGSKGKEGRSRLILGDEIEHVEEGEGRNRSQNHCIMNTSD